LDGRVDLEAVPNDPRIGEEPRPIGVAVGGHSIHVEAVECATEILSLLEDRQPREARLVDLEDQPLEELVVAADRESVLAVVIRPVVRVAFRGLAIAHWLAAGGRYTWSESGTRGRPI